MKTKTVKFGDKRFKFVAKLTGDRKKAFESRLFRSAGVGTFMELLLTKAMPKPGFWDGVAREFKCEKPGYEFFSGVVHGPEIKGETSKKVSKRKGSKKL